MNYRIFTITLLMDKLGNRVHITLPPEDDEGNIEYKWNLANINSYKRNKLTSQMKWRVKESSDSNSALYILGIHDNGQLTGLARNDLIATYINLIDCASRVGLYTCLRSFRQIHSDYWALLQVFYHSRLKSEVKTDYDLPQVPNHDIPDYLCSICIKDGTSFRTSAYRPLQ